MKRTLAVSMLAAALAAGCATAPPAGKQAAANATDATAKAFCVRETGSRIQPKPGDCIGPGRTYSRDELERTGEFTSAEALKKLDPRLN